MEPENELLSSASPSSPSDREFPDAQGSGSSLSRSASPPMIGSETERPVSAEIAPLPPPSKPLPVPKAPISESLAVPLSSSVTSSGHLSSSASSTRSSPGLWRKIKGLRPSSASNEKPRFNP